MKYQYIFLLLLLCACTRSSAPEEGLSKVSVSVDFSEIEKSLSFADFVESKQVVRLNLPDNEAIGCPVQVCTSDSCLFIYDQLQMSIYRFTKDGTFLNKIHRQGQGPGEYSTVTRLMVGSHPDVLYLYDKIAGNIHVYTFEGDFLRTIKTEYMANYITLLPDGGFLCFTPDYIYNGPCGIWRMSADGKMEKMLLEYKEKYPVVLAHWNRFYALSSQAVGIACPATDRYMHYDFAGDSLSIELQIKPKQKTTSSVAGIENSIDVHQAYWTCPFYACSSNFIFGIWTEQNGDPHAVYSLYDKRKNKMTCYSKLDATLLGNDYWHPIVSDLPGCLVLFLTDEADDETSSLCICRLK